MNNDVKKILNSITSKGYDAYIIGGYVRDYILGINSNDYDICTNCTIDILKDLLSSYEYEIELSTIKIVIGNINIDITPYRKEIEYENRKPIKYVYTNKLDEDLLRRDFTINTICMDSNLNIIDKLNGVSDITNKIIKCVGNIEQKLVEDPLRILRCIRFSAKYNFNIDGKLIEFINNNGYLLENISYEKRKEEIIKIIECKGLNLLLKYNLDKYLELDLSNIEYYSNSLITLIKIDVNNKYCISKYEKNINKIIEIIDKEGITNYNLYKYGSIICDIYNIDGSLYNNLIIHNRKDININSYDIINIVKDEKLVEEIYTNIERSILDGNLDNDYKKIIEYINKIC